jgi:hypothetical protein
MLRIRDVYPGSHFFHPGSRIRLFPSRIPDPNCFHPGSRIRIKEFKYFNPKKWFLSSRKYDPGCSSRIRILTFYPSRIPGSKRHPIPDPQHCCQLNTFLELRYRYLAAGSRWRQRVRKWRQCAETLRSLVSGGRHTGRSSLIRVTSSCRWGQCCGSESGSVGSVCFWASWIWIH